MIPSCFTKCMEEPCTLSNILAEPENSQSWALRYYMFLFSHYRFMMSRRDHPISSYLEIISCGATFAAWLPITIYISMLTFNAFVSAALPKTSYAFSTSVNLKSGECPCQQSVSGCTSVWLSYHVLPWVRCPAFQLRKDRATSAVKWSRPVPL